MKSDLIRYKEEFLLEIQKDAEFILLENQKHMTCFEEINKLCDSSFKLSTDKTFRELLEFSDEIQKIKKLLINK